ncbi:hypothetical protein NDU88_001641 [Pleurodeles waltl]|uniref:Uncharacterized protein n=1 Tax=Pleurodeles waltl TaxID=8319 RepID=A0AAV7V8C8_PLEWA|nr:hypothetical protein NDU88_001641 [Pleurodeles waltl]
MTHSLSLCLRFCRRTTYFRKGLVGCMDCVMYRALMVSPLSCYFFQAKRKRRYSSFPSLANNHTPLVSPCGAPPRSWCRLGYFFRCSVGVRAPRGFSGSASVFQNSQFCCRFVKQAGRCLYGAAPSRARPSAECRRVHTADAAPFFEAASHGVTTVSSPLSSPVCCAPQVRCGPQHMHICLVVRRRAAGTAKEIKQVHTAWLHSMPNWRQAPQQLYLLRVLTSGLYHLARNTQGHRYFIHSGVRHSPRTAGMIQCQT